MGIFTYIWLIFMVHVGKYTSPMDPMGNGMIPSMEIITLEASLGEFMCFCHPDSDDLKIGFMIKKTSFPKKSDGWWFQWFQRFFNFHPDLGK